MIHVKLTQNVGSWLTGTELGFIDLTHADAVLGAGTYVQTYPATPPTQAQLDAATAAAITYNKAHRLVTGAEYDGLLIGPTNVTVGADGTITATPASGPTQTITFNADGTVSAVYGPPLDVTITTTFNADGTMTEVQS